MTVESFTRCPCPGCAVRVWGPTRTVNYCKAHGGNQLDFPEIVEDDEWGDPIEGGPPVPPPAVPAIHLGRVED